MLSKTVPVPVSAASKGYSGAGSGEGGRAGGKTWDEKVMSAIVGDGAPTDEAKSDAPLSTPTGAPVVEVIRPSDDDENPEYPEWYPEEDPKIPSGVRRRKGQSK